MLLCGRQFVSLADAADGHRGFAEFIVTNDPFFAGAFGFGLVRPKRIINHLMTWFDPAMNQGKVSLVDLAVLELRAEFPVGLV